MKIYRKSLLKSLRKFFLVPIFLDLEFFLYLESTQGADFLKVEKKNVMNFFLSPFFFGIRIFFLPSMQRGGLGGMSPPGVE